MLLTSTAHHRRLRSFVRRNSRETVGQKRAYEELWPQFGLTPTVAPLNYQQIFNREAPLFLEIGFGSGVSLLALAQAHPEYNFIGVETHKPGIGTLLKNMRKEEVSNIRIHYGDAVDFLTSAIPDASLAGVQIFFPDPWQKRRHHPRRLIQSAFIQLLIRKCQMKGSLHLATDWEDYAIHMMNVLEQEQKLKNTEGCFQYAKRSLRRPVLTKFEERAVREGRHIWELQFVIV